VSWQTEWKERDLQDKTTFAFLMKADKGKDEPKNEGGEDIYLSFAMVEGVYNRDTKGATPSNKPDHLTFPC